MMKQKKYQIHQELIEQCRIGNRHAQAEIYRLYYRAMYNTSLRMLNDPVEAEDVMQESFLSAFMKIGSYKGEISFGAWLKRIVINKTIDVLRTRKVKFEELNEKSTESVEPLDADILMDDENALLVSKIKEAVKMLPEGFRVVLTLALFEGFDHEEIAGILNISESTSRSQLTRARKKLVEYLKKKQSL